MQSIPLGGGAVGTGGQGDDPVAVGEFDILHLGGVSLDFFP